MRCYRYSSVIEDGSSSDLNHYLATCTSASRVTPPQYLTSSNAGCLRSNSYNRVLSPTFDNQYSRSKQREPLTSSGSSISSSLRLDNFVTLRRRSLNYTPASASSSPMVLSPSATRQYIPAATLSPSSREGSVTPRFSHSCSNASLNNVSEADQ